MKIYFCKLECAKKSAISLLKKWKMRGVYEMYKKIQSGFGYVVAAKNEVIIKLFDMM
jgi:hypothetical protein